MRLSEEWRWFLKDFIVALVAPASFFFDLGFFVSFFLFFFSFWKGEMEECEGFLFLNESQGSCIPHTTESWGLQGK